MPRKNNCNIGIRLPLHVKEKLQSYADREFRSTSNFLAKWICDQLMPKLEARERETESIITTDDVVQQSE